MNLTKEQLQQHTAARKALEACGVFGAVVEACKPAEVMPQTQGAVMSDERVYFKITMPDGAVWYASGMLHKPGALHSSPELALARVRCAQAKRNPGVRYELASVEDYNAYKAGILPAHVLMEQARITARLADMERADVEHARDYLPLDDTGAAS